jgi:selenocysteine lyase/cysteine desulfurase
MEMIGLTEFRRSLAKPDVIADLRSGLIGDNVTLPTAFGPKTLVYADYVASGRALRQIENFILENVLPFYANAHTEASFCGAYMTRLRDDARQTIARLVNAGPDCHVIFAGSGATAGFNKIVRLLEIPERTARGERVTVLIGPYEHHSNILPWRESGADVIEIAERADGGFDLPALEAALKAAAGAGLIIGSFSAASNVTGIITDPDPVTRMLKQHGALAIWDYACAAPYLTMDMTPAADCAKDAIVFSPHKFPGGPGASGILVIRDSIVRRQKPTAPGGGSVTFVSPWDHTYSGRVEAREEAGTPDCLGDVRAALAMLVKEAVGVDAILARDEELRLRALAAWAKVPHIRLLGQHPGVKALPIFSFQIRDDSGIRVHHQLFTRMLSDVHGVQVRGGCACAGPYAHRLLDIDAPSSASLLEKLKAGDETERPGWIRLNLSYLHSDAQVEKIIASVIDLANNWEKWQPSYSVDTKTARFKPMSEAPPVRQSA